MKSIVLCIWLAACLAGVGAATAAARDDKKKDEKPRPDMSGTWTLDRSKSDFGPFRERPISKADSTLVIAHHDPELKITRTLTLNGQQETKEFNYYTDGRGEANPAVIGTGEVKSKTKWDGDKVSAHSKMTWPGQNGAAGVEMDVTQKWQVSADGKTLTNTTALSSGQMGVQEIKLVYRRGA
ncbi:MAG: hypothetical protein QOE46_55 [Acidobacteriota bacterium]|jgi:hypothetical protein|nr:hypothetical protein [Acidobacteriota bacterium]